MARQLDTDIFVRHIPCLPRRLQHFIRYTILALALVSISADLIVAVNAISSVKTVTLTSQKNESSRLVQIAAAQPHKNQRLASRYHVFHVALSNIPPDPNFLRLCTPTSILPACLRDEIIAINNARRSQGLSSLRINIAGFISLTSAQQVFTIINLERTARRLKAVGALTTQLNAVAQSGATQSTDPILRGWTLVGHKSVTSWASNWAGGLNVLGADYMWMYDDGVGFNIGCTATISSGCWNHEKNLLLASPTASSCRGIGGQPELVMGAAVLPSAYQGSTGLAELMVSNCGGFPTDVIFTWAAARKIIFVPSIARPKS